MDPLSWLNPATHEPHAYSKTSGLNPIVSKEGRKEMFYLTTHSTHFIYGYMASDIWLRTILIVRKETRCRHIGYSFRLAARVLLYAPSHWQDSTYHGLCYTSRGALVGTRNMLVRKEGNVLFNDVFVAFYLRLYGVRHMVKDHSDSERGNPLPHYMGSSFRLAVTPVVEHWLEREIADY